MPDDELRKIQLAGDLQALLTLTDREVAHRIADRLLLEFIGDPDVTDMFDQLLKWYA
jgi:hypothetical protein